MFRAFHNRRPEGLLSIFSIEPNPYCLLLAKRRFDSMSNVVVIRVGRQKRYRLAPIQPWTGDFHG